MKNRPLLSVCLMVLCIIASMVVWGRERFIKELRPSPIERYAAEGDNITICGKIYRQEQKENQDEGGRNMSIREILKDGEPALSKVCHPVTQFDQKLWDLLDDLKETLAQANGVGLAAPQVGILRRAVIVMDENFEPMELVNPEILAQEGEQNGLEGCLSVPGLWGYVTRPQWVKVKAQDRKGNWFEVEGQDLTARCFCHELSHLDGHLYTELTDRLYDSDELDELMEENEK